MTYSVYVMCMVTQKSHDLFALKNEPCGVCDIRLHEIEGTTDPPVPPAHYAELICLLLKMNRVECATSVFMKHLRSSKASCLIKATDSPRGSSI